jgi:hypothetical protein
LCENFSKLRNFSKDLYKISAADTENQKFPAAAAAAAEKDVGLQLYA